MQTDTTTTETRDVYVELDDLLRDVQALDHEIEITSTQAEISLGDLAHEVLDISGNLEQLYPPLDAVDDEAADAIDQNLLDISEDLEDTDEGSDK